MTSHCSTPGVLHHTYTNWVSPGGWHCLKDSCWPCSHLVPDCLLGSQLGLRPLIPSLAPAACGVGALSGGSALHATQSTPGSSPVTQLEWQCHSLSQGLACGPVPGGQVQGQTCPWPCNQQAKTPPGSSWSAPSLIKLQATRKHPSPSGNSSSLQ